MMATRMGPGASSSKDDDAEHVADDKMKSDARNPVLMQNLKQEKD